MTIDTTHAQCPHGQYVDDHCFACEDRRNEARQLSARAKLIMIEQGLCGMPSTTLDSVVLGRQVEVVRLSDVRRLLASLMFPDVSDVVPLCPVCGKPAERRAWCSAECEAADLRSRLGLAPAR